MFSVPCTSNRRPEAAHTTPRTLYGSSPADIARAKIQTLAVADEFPSILQDLIAAGVKTHFIYQVVAKNNGYKAAMPDVLEDRPGQMEANGQPTDVAGMTEPTTDAKVAGERIMKNLAAWAPPVPGPVDIKSVNWATERFHANCDGNQGASSRTLASGALATGDPRMVNVTAEVGMDADIRISGRFSLVPQVRMLGANGALVLRPTAALRATW